MATGTQVIARGYNGKPTVMTAVAFLAGRRVSHVEVWRADPARSILLPDDTVYRYDAATLARLDAAYNTGSHGSLFEAWAAAERFDPATLAAPRPSPEEP